MEIRNLASVDFNEIYLAFSRAFADYSIRFDREEILRMLKRRGFNPDLSFAAFHDGEIVAFTLNGTGMYNGIPTAYDTGTGTVKEHRGKGLAQTIFRHSVPLLRQSGINQYLLEVLRDNESAIAVYRKLGFRTNREFACYRRKKVDMNDLSIVARRSRASVVPIDVNSVLRAGAAFGDFSPSWQNSLESIRRAGDDLMCLGAYLSDEIVGYSVFDPLTGDLTNMAVASDYRRRGIASSLLFETLKHIESDSVKLINVCSSDETLPAFISAAGLQTSAGQYEMTLPL